MPVTRNASQRREVERVLSAIPATPRHALRKGGGPTTHPAPDACAHCGEVKRPDRAYCSAECATSARSDICGVTVPMIIKAMNEPITMVELRIKLGLPADQRDRLYTRLTHLRNHGKVKSWRISDKTGSRVLWQVC